MEPEGLSTVVFGPLQQGLITRSLRQKGLQIQEELQTKAATNVRAEGT